jgi:ankyrin repeat protein
VQGHLGFTALHGAVFYGHSEVVKMLLAAGAGVSSDLKDKVTLAYSTVMFLFICSLLFVPLFYVRDV